MKAKQIALFSFCIVARGIIYCHGTRSLDSSTVDVSVCAICVKGGEI